MTPTVAEPFVGAGGMALGLERAGFSCVWAGESDPRACTTFRAAFPAVPLFEGTLTVESIASGPPLAVEVDLLAGGPPCQPFSTAGTGLGEYDPRDGFPIFLALTSRVRPRAVLLENVPGLTNKTHRPYLDRVCSDLRALGYRIEWRVLDAADFGVPQRRRRVFIVGLRSDVPGTFVWPEPTHSIEALVRSKWITGDYWAEAGGEAVVVSSADEAHVAAGDRRVGTDAEPSPTVRGSDCGAHHAHLVAVSGRLPSGPSKTEARVLRLLNSTSVEGRRARQRAKLLRWRTVRDALGDLAALANPAPGLTQGERDYLVRDPRHLRKHRPAVPDSPAPTQSANNARGAPYGLLAIDAVDRAVAQSIRPLYPDLPSDVIQGQSGVSGWHPPILRLRNLGAGDGLGAGADDPAPTVPARAGGTMGLAVMDAATEHRYLDTEGREHKRPAATIRRLTTAECAVLQGFLPDWPWNGSKTAVYRQVGNACPPPLAEAVARAIRTSLS